MDCPRCETSMSPVKVKEVGLDICPKCEGIWFDLDEMGKVLDLSEEEIANSPLAATWESEVVREEKPAYGEFICPRCGGSMMRYYYANCPEILIDGCEKGCGVFTDDGELKKIQQYLKKLKTPLSPEKAAEIKTLLEGVEVKAEVEEEVLIDSSVKMDNAPGIMHYPSEVLQFVYRLLYKAGLSKIRGSA